MTRAALHIAATLAVFLVGCGADDGDDDTPRPEQPRRAPTSLEARAEGRAIVATVNGRPVYEDCVATQAAAKDIDRRAALQQCIDFELLAHAALEHGYLDHPEVLRTREVEAVRELIQAEFEPPHDEPEEIPEPFLRRLYESNKGRFDHPEYRFVTYVRVGVPEDVPRGSPEDLEAEEVAEQISAVASAAAGWAFARGDEDGLDPETFKLIGGAITYGADLGYSSGEFDFPRRGRAVEPFADAGFAIPEIGMVSDPARTQWGWDVLLLTHILPERHDGFEEAVPELRDLAFEHWQSSEFLEWSARHSDDLQIEVEQEALEELAAAELGAHTPVQEEP